MSVGAYPGSFNPPTVAHLAITEAARQALGLDRMAWIVSRHPLGKPEIEVPSLDERLEVLHAVAATRPWLVIRLTDAQLLADVAAGYDALVVGADKWAQIIDGSWYDSPRARDDAVRRLPPVLIAPRPPFPLPNPNPPRLQVLDVGAPHAAVSSTGARGGRMDWMLPEAARFDEESAAWSDPDRYRATRRVSRGTDR